MKKVKLRHLIFSMHRYLGLGIGLIVVIIGLTGSLLVFVPELDAQIVQQRFGTVTPQAERLAPDKLVDIVKTAYANHPDWKVGQVKMLSHDSFYTIRLNRPDETQWEVFVNPYTGKIMGDRQRETAFFDRVYSLHYQLLGGDIGTIIVGIAALLLCILSLTGIVLWPGWRKLISGFKIKWDAHPKRRNFDLHKVAGIMTAVFLGAIAFTGFCWNFYDQTEPIIYAATLTPKPIEAESSVIKGKEPISLEEALQQSDAALPGALTTFITLPITPDAVFEFYKKVPEESEDFNSSVKVDQYSGKVLSVMDSRQAGLGDRVLNSFTPIHYGTFGGLPTRVLYIFVGLSPTVLMVTGSIMWWHRKKPSKPKKEDAIAPVLSGGGRSH
ncbi:MAG: PepSY-associated TM helix domain-containing protein [Thermosynechococcaceae cyanobacterium]